MWGHALDLLSGTLRVGVCVSVTTLGCPGCFMGTAGLPGTPWLSISALESTNGSVHGDSEVKHEM